MGISQYNWTLSKVLLESNLKIIQAFIPSSATTCKTSATVYVTKALNLRFLTNEAYKWAKIHH